MLYIILAAAFLFAIFVLFRDDHDEFSGSYNKDDGTKRKRFASQKPTALNNPLPRQQTAVQPRDKTAVRTPDKILRDYERALRPTLSWSYLYRLEYDEDLEQDTMETEIVGMNYYISESDIGPVNGIVKPEPGNPHDHRAQVVIRSDGKKLGYLPRHSHDEYELFNMDGIVCPFAGEIIMDKNGFFHADILIALPESRDFVKEELSDYLCEDEL